MLSAFLLTTFAALASQQPSANPTATSAEIQDLLQRKVLKQGQKTYWVQDILDQLYPHDPSLKVSLESNVEYFTAYVNSLRFYDQVRWYSNKLILDQHKIPKATAKQIEAEAKAWALDRNDRPSSVSSSMAVAGIEIEVRARLMALQPEEFSNKEIRTHFNSSIPEFFGRLTASWIRVPLFDIETNQALSEKQRMTIYQELDQIGKQLSDGKLEWKDAVDKHSGDLVSKRNGGRIGYLKRMDNRYDEEFMRQLFKGFGITIPNTAIVRGPIMGSRWVYLVRIEKIKSEGVVELSRVRDRVIRSLRLDRMFNKMAELAFQAERSILLPISTA
ncbi:MAG: peptidylprolyl isomerase [Planctomycetota bacterium]|nr:peptidylprolyl isomerase [Planctomycetota bacterium]